MFLDQLLQTPNLRSLSTLSCLLDLTPSSKLKRLLNVIETNIESKQANHSSVFLSVRVKMKLLDEELKKEINRDIGSCCKISILCLDGLDS